MKIEHTYRWRVIARGKTHITLAHLTEAQVRRDYPECEPEAVPGTLRKLEVPETADEKLEAFSRTPSQHGPSSAARRE